MTETPTPDYKSTVFLPTTGFPMRGDLPQREPELLARWQRIGLWERTTAAMQGRLRFVLHDGPIYSNGNLHIGHALNRILKDVIMRAHRMAGEDVPYIPGWDTHGLPTEWRVEEEYRKAGRDKDAVPVLDSATSAAASASTGWRCRPKSSSASASKATGLAATPPSISAPKPPLPPRSVNFCSTARSTAASAPSCGARWRKPHSPKPRSNTTTAPATPSSSVSR